VGILYTLLHKNGLPRQIYQLWMGIVAAVAVSIVAALLLSAVKASLGNGSVEKLVEALFMYITAGLLWYVIFWFSKHVSSRKELEGQAEMALSVPGWGIFLLVFFAILREGFETVIFLMSSFSIVGQFSYLGFFSGMALAIAFGYLVVVQGKRLNLRKFFAGTTLLLVFFASGMIAYGTHEFEEFLVKGNHLEWVGLKDKNQISRVWDVHQPQKELLETARPFWYSHNLHGKEKYTHHLHDKGTVGIFLKGFFGYNSNPNWVEFIFWFISLSGGLYLWGKFYLKKPGISA
jgi:high-affinity iron transporter